MKLFLPDRGMLKPNNEHDPLPFYYRPLLGLLYRKRLQMGLDLLPESGSTVLEVGVGSGILIPTLTAKFPAYTGADLVLAEGLPPLVAQGCQAQFVRADLLVESDLPEARFDVVVCLSVLEHIADTDRAAASLARTLAKGGTLVAGYPMVNRLMAGFFRTIGFANIEAHHVASASAIDRSLRRVLRPVARKTMPPFAPVAMALYQCSSWIKD
jgi:2-polyprenyl-3-methyl-5-hydroxy-6-metoxy-1,4-benzoquinol methylase